MANPRDLCLPSILLLAIVTGILGCSDADSARTEPSRIEQIDRALSAAAAFLTGQQSSDGAWRPDTYGAFRDGPSLTPLVLQALLAAPTSERGEQAFRTGTEYVVKMVQTDGGIDGGPRGLSYPVYTAANALVVLSKPCNAHYRQARDAWLSYLRARQLTEGLGWQPSDKEYGGWGYASGVPRKPKPGEAAPALTESNLSATVFALEALRAAGARADDPAVARALTFVRRCQNYDDDPIVREPLFDDGGFFFIYDDPVRNKGGSAGKDRKGRQRFASYGSTTADGLRALLACGLPGADARVAAARSWIEKNFNAADHPGTYVHERRADRPALYFYYCCSVAKALHTLNLKEVQPPTAKVAWAGDLADHLLSRQRADGGWVNPARAVREDEPVLATALAMLALANCRDRLVHD